MKPNFMKLLRMAIILGGVAFLVTMDQPFPSHLTKFDFRAYWGASHLLANGQDFSDSELLYELQLQGTGWDGDEALMTWNPPWFLAWFLPLGLLSFERASWIWFLINLGLIFTTAMLFWRLAAGRVDPFRGSWIGLLLAFLFLPSMTILLVGQVTALVLFGLVGYLTLDRQGHSFSAGLALSLATIKPHLVFVTLPLLLVGMMRERKWSALAGFTAPLLFGLIAVFILRPSFLSEYSGTITGSGLIERTTVPTLPGFLSDTLGWEWIRFAGLVALPVALVIYWERLGNRAGGRLPMVLTATMISVIASPFGWSFDVYLFLAPLLLILVWFVEGRIARRHGLSILLILVAANAGVFWLRSRQTPESSYFWFPLLLAALYLWAWLLRDRQDLGPVGVEPAP